MTQDIRFAIIGLGAIAPRHVAAIRSTPGARLVAVCGRQAPPTDAFAGAHQCSAWSTDYQHILARPDVDAVAICLPHHLHAEVGVAAARAGKHVLMEKPLAITVGESDRIIAACRRAGVALGVAYQGRFEALTLQLRAALQSGRLGRLLLASLYVKWYRDAAYYRSAAWRGAWQTEGGGALVTQGSHGLDLLLALAGPATGVQAQMATLNHAIEVEDAVQALLRFENGALGLVEATTVAYPGFSVRLEFSGTAGSVVFDHGAGTLHWYLRDPKQEWVDEGEASDGSRAPLAISPASHVPIYADFVAAIREGRPPAVDGAEARRSVELIQAIYRSARSGRRVRLGRNSVAGGAGHEQAASIWQVGR